MRSRPFGVVVLSLVLAVGFAIGAGPVGARVPAAGGPVREVPDTIAADCSVDVTGALAAFVNRAPKGATVELARRGCYRIDRSLVIDQPRKLTIDGNGATLQAKTPGDQARRHVLVRGGSDLVIRDLVVRGANPNAGAQPSAYNPTKAFQHGFAIQGTRGALLDRVEVYDVYGDFVYIGGEFGTGKWARDVRVTRSTFEGSGRQGIAIVAGKHITIDRNTIGGAGLSLFDLEANNAEGGALDIVIRRNTTGAVRHFWLANKGAGVNIGDVVVEDNVTAEPTAGLVFVYGPTYGYRGPFRFSDNTFVVTDAIQDEGSIGAFFLSRAKGVTIEGNRVTLPASGEMPAVENRDSLDIEIRGNRFDNASQELIVTKRVPATAPR